MTEPSERALPFLERLGLAVLRRTPAHAPVAGEDDPIHVLNADERAALELPNPPHRVFGVDPHRETTRLAVVVASLLYKGKIALTTFLIKAGLRSLLGQVMGRAVFELVTVPVTAVWNAVVCFLVVREARLRTMGPSAAVELVTQALSEPPSAAGRATAFRSVASAVVRTQDLHPNHHALLRVLVERLGRVDFDEVDDARRFLDDLRALDAVDQKLVLRLLVIAAVIDGKLTRARATSARRGVSRRGTATFARARRATPWHVLPRRWARFRARAGHRRVSAGELALLSEGSRPA